MDVVKNTFEEWDPKLSEVELHFRLLLLAVGVVIMSVCTCFCYCYYEWGNRSQTSSIDDAGEHEIQEIEVLPPSDDETAGASTNLLSGLKNSTSDGNDDISIQSDSEDTSEVVVVIKSNTEVSIEKDSGLNSSSKDDKENTSNISNDSDTKSKSKNTVDKENNSNDGNEQCSSRNDECGKPSVEGNSSKAEAASETNVDSEYSKTKITSHP